MTLDEIKAQLEGEVKEFKDRNWGLLPRQQQAAADAVERWFSSDDPLRQRILATDGGRGPLLVPVFREWFFNEGLLRDIKNGATKDEILMKKLRGPDF